MAKINTLIFCFDGTANAPEDVGDFAEDESISNILKMHAIFGGSCAKSRNIWRDTSNGNRQCSLYYSGVGTYGSPMRRAFNQLLGLKFMDVETIIKEALQDFEAKYKEYKGFEEDEDTFHILIFGFSRGAAIARIFAAQLGDINRRYGRLWAKFVRIFSAKAKKLEHEADFLGVFDTVAAMGKIGLSRKTRPASDVVFENCNVAPKIKYAVHLVALDEKRLAFRPTLFNHSPKRVLEVWFPGAHSDVGGGFWFSGLSDGALEFMLNQVLQRFPATKIADPSSQKAKQRIDYSMLNMGDEKVKRPEITRDDLDINPIPYGRSHSQKRTKLKARITLHHRLLCVNRGDKECQSKIPLVHWSVGERFRRVPDYRPIALRNRRYRLVDKHGQAEQIVRSGIADLREKMK